MSHRIYIRATIAVIACTASVAAQAPVPVDVCKLLTVQEAWTAVGETVKDGKGGAPGRSVMPNTSASYCEWASATSPRAVHINVWHAAAPTQMQQMGTMVCGGKTKDGLEGLGDIACWYDTKHEE